jgi:3-oxoacyl-[acyl-carrier protein] reductase
VNLTGVFNTCQATCRRMLARGCGQIINIASVKGLTGGPEESAYAASKAGVIALSKSLAQELAPGGVRVNAVCPGYIPSRLSGIDERTRAAQKKRALLDIRHNLDDLADFIEFLCADRLRSVTGQVFHIDSRVL